MRILDLKRLIASSTAVIALVFLLYWIKEEPRSPRNLTLGVYPPQLEMQGGQSLHSIFDANDISE